MGSNGYTRYRSRATCGATSREVNRKVLKVQQFGKCFVIQDRKGKGKYSRQRLYIPPRRKRAPAMLNPAESQQDSDGSFGGGRKRGRG